MVDAVGIEPTTCRLRVDRPPIVSSERHSILEIYPQNPSASRSWRLTPPTGTSTWFSIACFATRLHAPMALPVLCWQ